MLVRLTSSTSGTMVMFARHARVLFGWMGKECTAKGVFTEEQLPDALARLLQGVETEKLAIRQRAEEEEEHARREPPDTADAADADPDEMNEKAASTDAVSLVQRAQPLIRLMEWTQKEGGFILWEAPDDF